MPDTQDEIGTQEETSANDTQRGGREIPTEPQEKIGTLHEENRNAKPSGGSLPGNNDVIGFRGDADYEPSTTRANDHIRKIADNY